MDFRELQIHVRCVHVDWLNGLGIICLNFHSVFHLNTWNTESLYMIILYILLCPDRSVIPDPADRFILYFDVDFS